MFTWVKKLDCKNMNKKRITWISVIAVVVLAIIGIVILKGKQTVDVITDTIENGTVQTVVTSTGYVQPVLQVSVGTQVSGIIDTLFVDFNSVVKKGQLLATLDMSVLNEKLIQAQAALSAANSALILAKQTFDRTDTLYSQKAETQSDWEAATNGLKQAKMNYDNAYSNLKQAKINLGYAKIYSPIDGVILNRAVDQGQTVAASFNTPTLFLIANDLTKMEVQANMDEADVGGLLVGQNCKFTVDAYPDLTFDGVISQIRLNPVTTSNVVTYTVIIIAPNPDKKLFPGMTANITVILQEEKGLVVPMGALRFTPTAQIAKLMNVQLPAQPQKAAKGQHSANSNSGGSGSKKAQSVWIQNADGTYTHQPVEIGLSDGINAIIKSGLQQGQKVVESVTLTKSSNSAASNPLIPKRPQSNQNQNKQGQGSGSGRPS